MRDLNCLDVTNKVDEVYSEFGRRDWKSSKFNIPKELSKEFRRKILIKNNISLNDYILYCMMGDLNK